MRYVLAGRRHLEFGASQGFHPTEASGPDKISLDAQIRTQKSPGLARIVVH
jgi:hypothetical protein